MPRWHALPRIPPMADRGASPKTRGSLRTPARGSQVGSPCSNPLPPRQRLLPATPSSTAPRTRRHTRLSHPSSGSFSFLAALPTCCRCLKVAGNPGPQQEGGFANSPPHLQSLREVPVFKRMQMLGFPNFTKQPYCRPQAGGAPAADTDQTQGPLSTCQWALHGAQTSRPRATTCPQRGEPGPVGANTQTVRGARGRAGWVKQQID